MLVLAVLAGGLVAVAALLWWHGLSGLVRLKGMGLGSAPPPYEQPSDLPERVARLDQAVFRTLFRLGVPAEDVHFEKVERQRRNGSEWEQATLRVELPRKVDLQTARRELEDALSGLGARAEWQPQGEGACLELSWQGLLTHRLLLRPWREVAAPRPPLPAELPRVALVVDDLGYDLGQAERLLALGAPLTFSVLPLSPHGREIAEEARQKGREVLLHLPMEAAGLPVAKLGEGALLMEMDAAQLLRTLRQDLDDLPGVNGVNNHMGSALTANEPRMKVVLGELKRRGLFFLDSRTTPDSVGLRLAEEMGLPATRRRVFLDNVQDKEAVLAQLAKLAAVARADGEAVAICHPYPTTLAALEEGLGQLKKRVRLVSVSSLTR